MRLLCFSRLDLTLRRPPTGRANARPMTGSVAVSKGGRRYRFVIPGTGSANSARQPQHEDQDLRHRLVELGRNLVAEFDIGERAGQHLVLLDRDVMGLGDLDDFGADRALALGDDPRRAALFVMQLSLIHISEPTRLGMISYAVFCLK